MFKKTKNFLLLLAICAVLVPMTGSAEQQVERPWMHHSEQTIILDFSNWLVDPMIPWEIEWQSGQATHLGLYTSSGTGTFNLDTGESNGSGYATAANGDKVYWESGPSIITWTGGTGPFEGASGSWTDTRTIISSVWDGYLLIETAVVTGEGTITY
jgi:hypothetical protein